jgi:hypothetical protein
MTYNVQHVKHTNDITNNNITQLFFFFKFSKTKRQIIKQTDRQKHTVFFHTPKLELHIVLNLHLFFFLIIIHDFLTLKYGGGRDMLMIRIASIILINHARVMFDEWAFVYTVRMTITI